MRSCRPLDSGQAIAFGPFADRFCRPSGWPILAPLRGHGLMSVGGVKGDVLGRRRDRHECRVGPGNFTPSPSQIRTGYSRIFRLVPSHEGCRLPLNEGLLSANQLAQISGDDPPPSLQPHYRTFVATTRQSAPLRRIRYVLSASRWEPLAPFPLASSARFSRSVPEPDRASRCLYAGCRSVGIRAPEEDISDVEDQIVGKYAYLIHRGSRAIKRLCAGRPIEVAALNAVRLFRWVRLQKLLA